MSKVVELAPRIERQNREKLRKLRDMNACDYTKKVHRGCSERVETCIRYRAGARA
jgi:hypothetical protein